MEKNCLIELKCIEKEFDGEQVLKGISLSIRNREFVTLLGPSGCGKTTTLRIIGGFESPTSGDVLFEGKRLNDIPPYKREINTVFQRYALFPHLDVAENIAFGLRIRKTPETEIQSKVHEMLELVGLRGFERREVTSLSGGQQQRVAIARAVAAKPPIIMADEPTGNLDSGSGKEIMDQLSELNRQGTSIILITHDNKLAEMARRIVTISDGHIISDRAGRGYA